ncbi:MAG: flagellar hook-basal body complex protein FliE [Ignavibacteriales bacterium]|nr:MAG: flagellar hook-basal body complex protein FliE [Ignavibacteriales bacterium]
MEIGSIGKISDLIHSYEIKENKGKKFENVLTEFIGEVNTNQMDSKNITEDFIAGEDVELHEVMIAGEKAKTSLELLMEIRNKTVDMYKELIRMQS